MIEVFDVDGVLLDSARAKSQAFYDTALKYGPGPADQMRLHHQQAGSIGRRPRWEHFYTSILNRTPVGSELEDAIAECTQRIAESTAAAPLLPGVLTYLEVSPQSKIVVSGIAQPELDTILTQKGLAQYFEAVYGGDKRAILRDLNLSEAVYYGDTEDDWRTATEAGLEFVLIYGASEWTDWQAYPITAYRDFEGLIMAKVVWVAVKSHTPQNVYHTSHTCYQRQGQNQRLPTLRQEAERMGMRPCRQCGR